MGRYDVDKRPSMSGGWESQRGRRREEEEEEDEEEEEEGGVSVQEAKCRGLGLYFGVGGRLEGLPAATRAMRGLAEGGEEEEEEEEEEE